MKVSTMIILSFVIIIALVVSIVGMIWLSNPLRMPQPMVTNYILRLTPIGIHIDDVIEVIEGREDWRVHYIDQRSGFVHPRLRGEDHGWPTDRNRPIIGNQSIRANVGAYQAWYKMFFVTHVDVFWGFDEDGYLIEIYVWKSIDVL